ncbi:MAG: hypothetical protein JWO52_7030, partial [Gammaproteobacteria bacterium]|nr:hypothetical protein [Gammaproteobacteria bacterium]
MQSASHNEKDGERDARYRGQRKPSVTYCHDFRSRVVTKREVTPER